MAWQFTEDVESYLAAAGGFLRARPAENTVILTAAAAVRARGAGAFGGSAPLFGWQGEPDGAVTAAFLHTPPFPVVLTAMNDGHAAALAAELAARGGQPAGVNAAPEPATAFAAAWQDHTGQAARPGMRMRLYALGQLLPPARPPPGQARTASAEDTALLLAWLDAFHDEAGPQGPNESERLVNDRIGFGGLVLWERYGPAGVAGRAEPGRRRRRPGSARSTPPRSCAAAVSAARQRSRSPRPPWTTGPRAWCCSPTWPTRPATRSTSASATARSATGRYCASAPRALTPPACGEPYCGEFTGTRWLARHSRSTFAITWRPVPPAAVRIDSGWNCTAHRAAAWSSIAITAPSGVTAVTVKPPFT